ncbi:TetR/AcrR family transcriptional regulator [Brachybacterium ginsengisoli]|uniref:TetR/AcrR family transcriptional regulator n=1 Tax=Brachybacterium ginsengisoli TaxID=1331682 RepID=UPI001D132663|nr:TetR/AcrR family transcriptional regulator [Brachybacterium ginsengisoli]
MSDETTTAEDMPAIDAREDSREAEASLGLRERKKRDSRIAMHRAALELVLEHGLSGVTVEAIAQRAGVSTRTFFNHWSTKESAIIGVLSAGGEQIGERLRHQLEEVGPQQALRAVMREAVATAPFDAGLRDLKKQVMAKEPKLHSLSSGNLLSVQTEMIEALTEAYDGDDAQERATLGVQIGFAVTRTAFSVSMSRGIDIASAFDEVLDRYDADDPLF